MYIDIPGPSTLFTEAGPSKAAYEEADEDMFAADSGGWQYCVWVVCVLGG